MRAFNVEQEKSHTSINKIASRRGPATAAPAPSCGTESCLGPVPALFGPANVISHVWNQLKKFFLSPEQLVVGAYARAAASSFSATTGSAPCVPSWLAFCGAPCSGSLGRSADMLGGACGMGASAAAGRWGAGRLPPRPAGRLTLPGPPAPKPPLLSCTPQALQL